MNGCNASANGDVNDKRVDRRPKKGERETARIDGLTSDDRLFHDRRRGKDERHEKRELKLHARVLHHHSKVLLPSDDYISSTVQYSNTNTNNYINKMSGRGYGGRNGGRGGRGRGSYNE
eukprot:scaffold711_cov255-Chaetoceros_neogracile.AAC.7